MKKILVAFLAALLMCMAALPVSASHSNPCVIHKYSGTGYGMTVPGAVSFDPEIQEYWTENGEKLSLVITANDISDRIVANGGIVGLTLYLTYNPVAVTFVDSGLDELFVSVPAGNTAAARADWLTENGTDYTDRADPKTGLNVIRIMATSYESIEHSDSRYAAVKDGDFVIKLEFTVNSGWTEDIQFKTTMSSVTDFKLKSYDGAGFIRNVKSYAGLEANSQHSGEWTTIIESTCTTTGYAELRCKTCNEIAGVKELPFGHVPGEYVEKVKLSCVDDGVYESYCTLCNALADTKIELTPGHDFSEWAETKAPTYTEKGEEERVCSVCDTVETRRIPMLEGFGYIVSADNTVVSGADLVDGSTLAVTVALSGGADINSIKFNLEYDRSVIRFTEAVFAEGVFASVSALDNNGYVAVTVGAEDGLNIKLNGKQAIVVLYFTVITGNGVEAKNSKLTVVNKGITDADGKPISIQSETSMLFDVVRFLDLDNDGSVTLADAISIYNIIAEGSVKYAPAADVDRDGVITLFDFIAVYKHITGEYTYADMLNGGEKIS